MNLKNVLSDQKSNCRTYAEGCQMPFKEAGYDLSIDGRFMEISDDSLNQEVEVIKKTFPACGERTVIGCLRSKGIFVPRHRLREIIRVHDPIAVLLCWTVATSRRKYSVPGPNALWHIDGLHKLIRWGFVVHGCINGFLRMITYLKQQGIDRTG